jgi:hypothetical protein
MPTRGVRDVIHGNSFPFQRESPLAQRPLTNASFSTGAANCIMVSAPFLSGGFMNLPSIRRHSNGRKQVAPLRRVKSCKLTGDQ